MAGCILPVHQRTRFELLLLVPQPKQSGYRRPSRKRLEDARARQAAAASERSELATRSSVEGFASLQVPCSATRAALQVCGRERVRAEAACLQWCLRVFRSFGRDGLHRGSAAVRDRRRRSRGPLLRSALCVQWLRIRRLHLCRCSGLVAASWCGSVPAWLHSIDRGARGIVGGMPSCMSPRPRGELLDDLVHIERRWLLQRLHRGMQGAGTE
mmetsp:Transcript_26271/g.76778  ORF Transcript_26271/g.76778 Transcript_26271/m.76778 type:complete len:213 (-) Transcript_26271:773-1411(-)